MLIKEQFDTLDTENSVNISIEEPNQCPMCKKHIKPTFLFGYANSHQNDFEIISKVKKEFYVMFECRACYRAFIKAGLYCWEDIIQGLKEVETLYLAPNTPVETCFSDKIHNISLRFVNIYNQAKAAENYNLFEIAGMGYRKALEILVKDYLISQDPSEKEIIIKTDLSKCIKLIADPRIQTTASRAAWLGNDESHYMKKHEDRDINDLKKLIELTCLWIEMELLTQDAEEMEPKK